VSDCLRREIELGCHLTSLVVGARIARVAKLHTNRSD
jgi:hypothetical protein